MKGKPRRRYLILEVGEGKRGELVERLSILPYRSELKLIPLGTGIVLLRCNHLQTEEVRRSLEAWKGGVRILGVSGTIRGAKRILRRRGFQDDFPQGTSVGLNMNPL